MRPDAHERLRAAIERKNAARGRPLTPREKLANVDRELGTDLLGELARAKVAFQLRAIETIIRGPALAAGTGTAETRSKAQSEGCQSGGDSRNAQPEPHP